MSLYSRPPNQRPSSGRVAIWPPTATAINTTTTIKAIAIVPAFSDSDVTTGVYTISALTVATPVMSPTSTSFPTTLDVTITDSTFAASIYYTLDGSTPTVASTLYTGAITLSATTTIKAIGIRSGYLDSAIASNTYTLVPVAETILQWGGNLAPTLTDFSKWYNDPPNEDFHYAPGTPTPLVNFQADFILTFLDDGEYPYFVMLNSSDAPAASGGFKNGVFPLNVTDFAGPAEGFNDVDANGWPCIIGVWPFDGQTYREYRLKNQPFAAITLTITQ